MESMPDDLTPPTRRTFLGTATTAAMGAGLVSSYGTFGAIAARFLYPAGPAPAGWQFVVDLARFSPDAALEYVSPSGAPITIARRGDSESVDDFLAMGSTCPHLGCRVFWQPQHGQFFCPCHNGTFDASGRGTGGPPGEAGLVLPQYPLKVERGMLFIEVPLEALPGPGVVDGGRRT